MVLDEKSAEKLYKRLYLLGRDEHTRLFLRMKVVHIKRFYHLLIGG